MSGASSQDAATKARIISHMNRDHPDTVIRYLQYFEKLSASTAYDGKMTDLDLNGFTLSCRGKNYRVPFQPPMKSFAETRERTVQMDKDARKALGHSDVTVNVFTWPKPGSAIAAITLLLTVIGFSQRWWFAEGLVDQYLGAGVASTCWKIQPWLFYGLTGAHALETVVLSQTKLKKHSVNPRSSIYWMWIVSNFIEGFPCALRFNALVKKLGDKQKH